MVVPRTTESKGQPGFTTPNGKNCHSHPKPIKNVIVRWDVDSIALKTPLFGHHRSGLDPDSLTWPDLQYRIEYFKQEASTVFDAASILVGATIYRLMLELLEKVNESSLELYAIEP